MPLPSSQQFRMIAGMTSRCRRRSLLRKLLCAAVLSLTAVTIAAKAAEPEMTFKYTRNDLRVVNFGLRETIHASGTITPGTTDRLRAFLRTHEMIPGSMFQLSSPGGNLKEAMQLGLLIRGLSLNTQVGIFVPGQPRSGGYCYSACTIAFLGGLRRYVSTDTPYGVHRFSAPGLAMTGEMALDTSQVLTGELAGYVSAMGVRPEFIQQMSKSGPNEINLLTQQQLADLNVVTRQYETTWEIKNTPEGEFYVLGATTDERGIQKIIFQCPQSRKQPAFMLLMYNLTPDEGRDVIGATISMALNVDGSDRPIPPSNILSPPSFRGQYVSTIVRLDGRIVALLANAKELGFSMIHRNGMTFTGFQGDFTSGRDKVLNYLKACHL